MKGGYNENNLRQRKVKAKNKIFNGRTVASWK